MLHPSGHESRAPILDVDLLGVFNKSERVCLHFHIGMSECIVWSEQDGLGETKEN